MASLKDKAKTLPKKPGVYQMLNARGTVIYVGKARNLKNRVNSYFRTTLDSPKTAVLMSQVVDFQVTITGSDNEALLLESNLIKELKPRYNVLFRDDKSYPYLYLATEHKFPRLDFHRGAKTKPGRYFGPYPNAGAVRENLAMIQKLFKLRQCNDTFFRNRTRPCLQYQIKRCTAPCVNYVTPEAYQEQVKHALLFLEGKNTEVMNVLTKKMEQASQQMEYEKAAAYRDQVVRLRKLQTQQYITGDKGDIDIVAVAEKMGQIAVAILFVRAGRVIGNKAYFPNVPASTDAKSALSAFLPQFYLSPLRGEVVVERIVLAESLPDRAWIQNALQEKLGKHLQITDRKTARYKRWQSLAQSNANFALGQHLAAKNHIAVQLEALQAALKLPNPISRIECYDISHTMGEATVASCVVFNEEGPLKKDYRKFNIKNITPGDDYAAMHQALMRRYTKLKAGDAPLPDLVIIDGGLGQLRQAAEVLEELQVSGVMLLGVAKGPARKAGLEKLYLWPRKEPIQIKSDNVAHHLIQFIRDEAHRFAIISHRAKRAKTRKQSPLENIEGVGAKRRRELLRHFGGLQELSKANVADIAKVSGISEALAQRIYDALH